MVGRVEEAGLFAPRREELQADRKARGVADRDRDSGDAGEVRERRLAEVRRIGERRARRELDDRRVDERRRRGARGPREDIGALERACGLAPQVRADAIGANHPHRGRQQRELRQRARGGIQFVEDREIQAGEQLGRQPRRRRRAAELHAIERELHKLPAGGLQRLAAARLDLRVEVLPERRRARCRSGGERRRPPATHAPSGPRRAAVRRRHRGRTRPPRRTSRRRRCSPRAAPSPTSSSGRPRRSRPRGCASTRRCRCRSSPPRVCRHRRARPARRPTGAARGIARVAGRSPHGSAPGRPHAELVLLRDADDHRARLRSRRTLPMGPAAAARARSRRARRATAVVNMSFSVSGTPRNGPAGASASIACASSANTTGVEFSSPSRSAIRSSVASSRSPASSEPSAIASACSRSPSSCGWLTARVRDRGRLGIHVAKIDGIERRHRRCERRVDESQQVEIACAQRRAQCGQRRRCKIVKARHGPTLPSHVDAGRPLARWLRGPGGRDGCP